MTPNIIKRLAMINDISGHGRCSTTVSLPVISLLGVEVCPVPTAVLSNHLAFQKAFHFDFTPFLSEYIDTWKDLNVSFDGLYCGFLNSPAQVEIVQCFLDTFSPSFFLLDPCMGDHGKLYSSISKEHVAKMKKLLPAATVITPNLTEACLLTDTPFSEDLWAESQLLELCQKLEFLTNAAIVITGVPAKDPASHKKAIGNACYENGYFSIYTTPSLYPSRPGTGDLFASIISAQMLKGLSLQKSVKKAADFIALCVAESHKADVPIINGVQFEPLLPKLLEP